MLSKPRRVPAFRHIKKAIDPIVNVINKGFVIDTDDVIAERQPDGRVKLRLSAATAGQFNSAAAGPPAMIFLSTEQTYTASCPEGTTGDDVTVVKAAGLYYSVTSQADADANALAAATSEATAALVCVSAGTLPDTFYVAIRARFNTGESQFGGQFGIFAFNASDDFAGSQAFDLEMVNQGSGPFYDCLAIDFWSATSNNYAEFNGLTINADTYYVFDIKFELSPDRLTQTVTVRQDGSVVGTNTSGTPVAWTPTSFILGGFNSGSLSGGVTQINRDFDYFKIGSTGYGTDDLFSASFGTDQAPFDSLEGSDISVTGGNLHLENATDSAYALKTL
jgi:hypothetical protein